MTPAPDQHPLFRLIEIMARLRDPEGGCPWDIEQTFASIAPYTIEEAYEVADAIERGEMGELKEELGDLLLQVVYHARMAEEAGAFAFTDVAGAIADKMIRRHPHVFGQDEVKDAESQTRRWEEIKAAERAAKGEGRPDAAGALDGVPLGLPALTRAAKLTRRAARVGFDWPSTAEVMDKLREEVAELEVEIARKLDIEPETALRAANAKFERRFAHIERRLAEQGRTPGESDLAEMDALWDDAKAVERQAPRAGASPQINRHS